jgi:uncharacterized membrane protein YgcG
LKDRTEQERNGLNSEDISMQTRTSRLPFTQFTLAAALCGTLAVIWTAHLATAQDGPSGSGRGTALGVRQQRVERMVSEIERKFKALATALKETEPERAERLLEALKESRELQLNGRMTEIVKLLDQSQLDSALGGQQQALLDIRKLLALLLNEQNDREKALEESERLEKFRQQIESILQDQIKQKMEADRTANKDKTLADLEAQIKAVEELIQKQKAVNDETQAARGGAASKLGPVTDKQRQVKDETGKAADAMSGDEASKGAPAEEGDPNSPESKSGAAKSGDAKKGGKAGEPKSSPQEGDKGADEPAEGEKPEGESPEGEKSEGEKSSNAKSSGGEKSKGGKSGGKKSDSGEGSPQPGGEQPEGDESQENEEGKSDEDGEKKPPRAKPQLPAEQALRSAKQNQQKAENQLNKGKPRAAGQDQEKALEDLQKALSELKNDRDRIASLPPEAFKQMSEKQTDTSEQTKQLHAEMKQGKPQDGKSDGGKPSAGSESVQKAQQQMDQAAGDLDSQDPESASRKQAKAIKDLEKALEEIEERLAQLREETQLEKLARLEARFKEMLARQKEASKQTLDLHARRDSSGELSRVDRLAVGKVSAEEQALAEAAQQAYDIIVEDGTSVVFPEIVGQLRDDMASVGQMLAGQKTDPYVQSQQREIEISLEELIEALKKAQSQKESSGGGGGGGGGGEQPLLPSSAELKLLRFSQLRINRRTEAFDKNRPGEDLGDDLRGEMQNISKRQQDVSDMTLRILERQ